MWGVSEATVAYYAPHLGGLFNFVDRTGFIDATVSKGRVWSVSVSLLLCLSLSLSVSPCVSLCLSFSVSLCVCRKANCVDVRTVCALCCCMICQDAHAHRLLCMMM